VSAPDVHASEQQWRGGAEFGRVLGRPSERRYLDALDGAEPGRHREHDRWRRGAQRHRERIVVACIIEQEDQGRGGDRRWPVDPAGQPLGSEPEHELGWQIRTPPQC
jgi:hypothetical protein